ncbi:uncharacterized protein B0H18DRAFT_1211833 [Fomitopsis serialis]|uniref:uncharacterized protein n=1 Tax=Fomitopsis serialis TaxID=139415 RepID=UPI0020081E41|nr:uncharacterized protein B0H18DRAFT_1211833 [Neoantrodia serialis]KAH9924382.1 hypothetical protein B0H18DRAFT_1211833 [Neoantrodia serialis]
MPANSQYRDYTAPLGGNTRGTPLSATVAGKYRAHNFGVSSVGVLVNSIESATGPKLVLQFANEQTKAYHTAQCEMVSNGTPLGAAPA